MKLHHTSIPYFYSPTNITDLDTSGHISQTKTSNIRITKCSVTNLCFNKSMNKHKEKEHHILRVSGLSNVNFTMVEFGQFKPQVILYSTIFWVCLVLILLAFWILHKLIKCHMEIDFEDSIWTEQIPKFLKSSQTIQGNKRVS